VVARVRTKSRADRPSSGEWAGFWRRDRCGARRNSVDGVVGKEASGRRIVLEEALRPLSSTESTEWPITTADKTLHQVPAPSRYNFWTVAFLWRLGSILGFLMGLCGCLRVCSYSGFTLRCDTVKSLSETASTGGALAQALWSCFIGRH